MDIDMDVDMDVDMDIYMDIDMDRCGAAYMRPGAWCV
jgi:hypothetical protein